MRTTNRVLGTIVALVSAFGVATYAADAEAASAISWSVDEVECGDTSITVRIANERLSALPAGTATLGTFKASYAQIPAGGVRNVVLTSPTYWRCNNAALTLSLKTSTTTYSIPGGRATNEYTVDLPPIDEIFFELEVLPGIYACNEPDPWLTFHADINGFLPHDQHADVFLEGAVLGYMHTEIQSEGMYHNLDFSLANGCPHVATPVELTIWADDVHQTSGNLLPLSERAKGSAAY